MAAPKKGVNRSVGHGYTGAGWNPQWLLANAPAGTVIPGAGVAQGAPATAAPAPTADPQPYDPSLELQKLSAGFNTGLANSEAVYQTGQTAYNTGYNADGTSNASNPYSQAALLQQHYQQAQLGTTNSLAAQGQLYSGELLNAQGANDQNLSVSSDQLRRQAADQFHQIGYGQLQTYGQNAAGTSSDQFNSLLKSVYGS